MAYLQYIAILLAAQCSVAADIRTKRVIGGEIYKDGDYPFHVSLWYMGTNNPFTKNTPDFHHTCGGSLIKPNWVLTSALCFDDNFLQGLGNTTLWRVVLGMYHQSTALLDGTFEYIETVFRNPWYNLSLSYGDLALLKLKTNVTLGDRIKLVDYNTDDNCPSVGQSSIIIGWGQNQAVVYGLGQDLPSQGLVYATSQDYCHDAYADPAVKKAMGGIVIDDKYLCAGINEGGIDGCYGDSGSPLLDQCGGKEVVTGVMSTGYGCAQPKYPGVYTRVSAFKDWIAETIKNNP